MDATADDELRELRARAYGPHADIETDPEAVRRLEELESSRSTASIRRSPGDHTAIADFAARGEVVELRVVQPSAEASGESGELLDLLADESTWGDAAVSDASERPGRLTRWRTSLWVASVVVAAALAAAITYAFASIPPVSSSAGAPQIETLELTRTGAIPPGWFGAEKDAAAAEFYGLTIFETTGWVSESGDRSSENRCLNGVPTEDVPPEAEPDGSSYVGGRIYGACSVGSFPAALTILIDGDAPYELVERFPSGAALQFVLDGDRVGVFLDSSKG